MKRVVDLYKVQSEGIIGEHYHFVFDDGSEYVMSVCKLMMESFTEEYINSAYEYLQILDNNPTKIMWYKLFPVDSDMWNPILVISTLYYGNYKDFQYTLYLFKCFVNMFVRGKVYEKDS